jgi:hypothetical protein
MVSYRSEIVSPATVLFYSRKKKRFQPYEVSSPVGPLLAKTDSRRADTSSQTNGMFMNACYDKLTINNVFTKLCALLLLAGTFLSTRAATADEHDAVETTDETARMEWALLPAIGYDSDIGFKFGALTIFSKPSPVHEPYRWRTEAQFQMSVKRGPNGAELPIHDHFLKLDIPGLFDDWARLFFSGGFNKNVTAPWYGIGNATSGDEAGNPRRFQYKKQTPYVVTGLRVHLWSRLFTFFSIGFSHTTIDFWPGGQSRLEEDIARSEAGTGEELYGYKKHATLKGRLGLVWDSRDDETNPVRGTFAEISLRGSAGAWTRADHDFGGVNLSIRHHIPIHKEWLSIAFRLTGDLLFGKVPFGELACVQGTSKYEAVGGSNGVRGVPAGRYSGKVKVLASTELRAIFWRFAVFSHQFRLGAAAFVDGGRVWSDLSPSRELDGEEIGLKFGVGGGPQLLWGESVVIRIDTAYSKDADPVGIYFEAGRSF